MDIPAVSAEQMGKIEELAARHFGIEVVQLMENAGRSVAELGRQVLKRTAQRQVVVLAGKGHNGGDALVAGRFLHSWGACVDVIIPDHPDRLAQLTREAAGVLRSMFVQLLYPTDALKFELLLSKADLIIDGLLGYGIRGDPAGSYADIIRLANASGRKVLAVDIPSGLDPDTGQPRTPCIRASHTLTLALPKKGLREKQARPLVGELHVADIGLPPEVYQLMGLQVPALFAEKGIIRA
jgi:NAD(P)H-hydrate epimerase